MANCESLEKYGILLILIVGAFIVVPILRGSRDIISAWNVLLLGIIVFLGLGSIEAKYVDSFAWEWLNWFQPTAKEVRWYIVATTVFIGALIASYYWNTPAKRFAQRRFQKWPELSVPLVFSVIGFCTLLMGASIFLRQITFFGPATLNLAWIGAPAGAVFAFALWDRNRVNIGWLLIFLCVFCGSLLFLMVVSGGRRPVLSMFLGPILYIYGTHARHWSRAKLFAAIGLAMILIMAVGSVYSQFRWYNTVTREQRTAFGILEQLKTVRAEGDFFKVIVKGRLSYFGQSNALFALLTQRYVDQGIVEPIPLNSLAFLATYPIPRKVWAGKPEPFGITVARDASHVGTNWGLGVAGQGVCEGGLAALVLYGFLLAFGIRILDEPLKLQPSNPFLIYMHATVLPHIAGIPRGDMGSMVKEAGQGVLFVFLLGVVGRALFGAQRRSNSNQHSTSLTNVSRPVLPRTRIAR